MVVLIVRNKTGDWKKDYMLFNEFSIKFVPTYKDGECY